MYAAVGLVLPRAPTGDEGHYLAIAVSIAGDGDVDLSDDYGSSDMARLDPALGPLSPGTHAHRYRPDGPLLSTHGFGLGVLLAPVVWLGGGLIGVRLFLIVIAAALAAEVWALLAIASRARPAVRWIAWATTFLTLPLVVYANQIYAEVIGAFLVAVAFRRLLARSTSFFGYCVAGVAIGLLPWFHLRFLGIAFVLGLALLLRAAMRVGPVGAGIACGIPVASMVIMSRLLRVWYGSPWPGAIREAVYGPVGGPTMGLVYDNVFGSVLNVASGWLPFAPAHVIGLVGMVMLVCWRDAATLAAGVVVVAYAATLATSDAIYNGWSFPARMCVVLIPFVALPLTTALRARPALRVAFAPLVLLSVLYTALALRDPERLYPWGTTEVRLPVADRLAPIWPKFPFGLMAFSADPATMSRETGRMVAPGGGAPAFARAQPGADSAGWLTQGPFLPLLEGDYRAVFDVAIAPSAAPDDPIVATVDVASEQGRSVHGEKILRLSDGRPDGDVVHVELPFTMPAARNVETRVYFAGATEVRFAGVRVDPVGHPRRARDWGRAAFWVAIVGFAGVYFAQRRSVRGRYRP